MSTPRSNRPAWQRWIVRHLFLYLALVAGLTVVVSILAAREEIRVALADFEWRFIFPVLVLSGTNYALRFLKWDRLLRDSRLQVERASSARIYFSCLAMVVTPARLGELYKLVFLRKLHGIAPSKSLPPLVLERLTDALALLVLSAMQPFQGSLRIASVLVSSAGMVVLAAVLASPRLRRPWVDLATRIPGLRRRRERLEELLEGHARLLRPASFGPSLGLSVLAWWAEGLGLYLICVGLGATLELGDASWIYAIGTLVGNLTFLPGGLGGTELALATLLERAGTGAQAGLTATLLVRAATLWFAVFLGLCVTLLARRQLRWGVVREEASRD